MPTPINTGKSLNQIDDEFGAQPAAPAPGYDIDAYFARRLGNPGVDKINSVRAAAASKMDRLQEFRAALSGQGALFQAQQEADAKSWVGRLGLDPTGVSAELVNDVAQIASGFSGNVVGKLASLPSSSRAITAEAQSTDADVAAYNRYLTGQATQEDFALLNRKVAQPSAVDAKTGGYGPKPEVPTMLELMDQAQADRKTSRDINKTFDISSIVHMGKRRELDASLQQGFEENWNQIKEGWTGGTAAGLNKKTAAGAEVVGDGTGKWYIHGPIPADASKDSASSLDYVRNNNFGVFDNSKDAMDALAKGRETPAPQSKAVVDRAMQVSKGIANLLVNAGSAAWENKAATVGYVLENAPQLLVGAIPGVGGVLMTGSNVGYATDYYQQGIEQYQKDHKGQMPTQDDRKSIAAWAASLAVAEEMGDRIGLAAGNIKGGLKAITGVGEGAANMATDAAKVAARTSFKDSILGTAKAAGEGLVSEALTEGYQGYAENKTIGKADATPWEIYQQAVIGGLSGAHLSGGAHALHEVASSRVEKQQATVQDQQSFNEAAAKNDPTAYLDPQHSNYDPTKGIAVMYAHNQLQTTTPETKQKNLEQAADVMSNLDTQYEALTEQRKTADRKDRAGLELQMKQLERHITQGEVLVDQMIKQVSPAPTEAEMKSQVQQANTAVPKGDTQAAQQAEDSADKVINLSMQNTSNLSVKDAEALASNEDNSLTPTQRDYLRAFTTARQSESKLATMNSVSQTILYGDRKGNLGIAQYRQRIGNAIAMGNQEQAQRSLAMLTSFADVHASKAEAGTAAIQQGLGTRIGKVGGAWQVIPATATKQDLRVYDDVKIMNSARLVQEFNIEAQALANAKAEAQAAVNLHFNGKGVQSAPQAATPATPSATATPTPEVKTEQGQVPKYSSPEAVKPKTHPEETSASVPAKTGLAEADIKHAKQEEAVRKAQEASAARKAAKEAILGTQPVEDTKQQAEAKPTAQVADVSEAAAVVEETTPAEEAKKPFQERNLVISDFAQRAGKDTGSTRPLVEVPGFLEKLKTSADEAMAFLKDKALTEQQHKAISSFSKTASEWVGKVSAMFKPMAAPYRYQDLTQFLVDEKGQLTDNAKTAIAFGAYTWVAENISNIGLNTDAQINAILEQDKDAIISEDAERLLRQAGTRESLIINALGRPIVQALGLVSLASASQDLQPRLISHVGAYALKLLLDEGIIARETITGKDYAALLGAKAIQKDNQKFIDQKFIKPGSNVAKVEEIREAMKGTQGILNKLFGAEASMKEPSPTKIPFTQKNAGDGKQLVPSVLAKIMAHENASPSYVRQDMYHLMTQLHPDVALAIAGFESINNAVTHAANRASIQAKNEGLQREYDRMMDYFGVLNEQNQLEDPQYFSHNVWVQQRVGIDTNVINPQTSKLHRRMVARPSWTVTIRFTDTAAMNNFKLRVAEGLGVKTDKQGNEKSLQDAAAAINKPEIKAAVKVLRKALTEGDISPEEQRVLQAGVEAGGENMHTLDSLVAVAQYMEAMEGGKNEFTTQLMGEVDGVTNGPMLSHLLLGAANSVEDLYSLLNRGGFYQVDSGNQNYNVWRGTEGSRDLYEVTAEHMIQQVRNLQVDQADMAAIYIFTGNLQADDKAAAKARRDIVKTPLTAMVFGSSVSNAINSMADKFVASVYGRIEKAAAANPGQQETDRVAIIRSLTQLGIKVGANTTIEQMMERQFSEAEIATLKNTFTKSLGKAVAETMKQDFQAYIDKRRVFNRSAQLAFDLYNAAYTGLREQRIAELVKSGEIAVNATTGKPLQDLTNKQEAQLRKDVQSILPLVHTAFSQESNQLDAGLMASKIENEMSKDPIYGSQITFGNTFPDGSKSVRVRAMTTVENAPGVGTLVKLIHSFDSYPAHKSVVESEVLNVHDAAGAGLGNITAAAQNLNRNLWNGLLAYSPANEMADTLSRVMQGIAAMQDAGTLPESSQKNLQEVLAKYAAEQDTKPGAVLDNMLGELKAMAYEATYMKLQAMEIMGAVDQYALEGGQYNVTEADRKAVKKARQQLDGTLTAEDQSALATLSSLASNTIKVEVKQDPDVDPVVEKAPQPLQTPEQVKAMGSPWGDIGAPAIASDAKLVQAFNHQPVMAAREAVKILRNVMTGNPETRGNTFAMRLLDLVEKTLPANMTVQMVTPATPHEMVMAKGADMSRGWFVAKGDENAVYLLSPDFKYSGLTAETMLHEMVHGALARTVQAELDAKAKDASYQSDTLALVEELETLRTLAQKYVTENKLNQFKGALENVHELISWGMSNLEFQRQVLNNVSIQSGNKQNPLIKGMKRFIEALTGILFKGSSKSAQEQANNGMAVLIANVSGLFYTAAQTKSKADLVLNQMNTGPNINAYSTTELFEGLASINSNTGTQVSPAFSVQLRGLLQGIVDQLHGPYGSFKEAYMTNRALTPTDLFARAMVDGTAPFAAESLASGFRTSEQEAYVMEQVEATMRAALVSNEGHTTAAYQELAKLYDEVSAKLKVEDFHPGSWATATQAEKADAQALYDFMFKLEQGSDKKSNHLARFAAVGLANERVANLLSFATDVKTDRQLSGLSFTEKLHAIYDMVLSWLNGQFTHTFEGQQANEKLESLVGTLVGIEAKKAMKLGQQRNRTVEYMEDLFRDASETARDKLEEFGRSAFFKTKDSAFIKAAGTAISAVAGDRVGIIMEGINKIRDQHFRERHGLVAGLINEIRGAKADNLPFHKLLRTSKHIEGQRKDIITNVAKFTLESFANGGSYLTGEHKAAIAQTVLRTDAAALLNGYSVADAINLIGDKTARTAEIARLASQLTGVANFGHYFVKASKVLGHYKATGRVSAANIMFNAGNIARLYGTPYAGRISEAQATKVMPAIDTLVTLYALDYVNSQHAPYMKEVLAAENARTDGNGIEMILKLHKELQQQSKDRLFVAGDPLFMKGYVPELFNPYIDLKMANEDDGYNLVQQGYVEGPALATDRVDPDQSDKKMYVLRDGGLQSHLTGIMSYTGRKAKGTQVTNGSTNLLSAVGQANSQTMNDIHNGKQPQIRDMFRPDPGFDPRKVGDTHLAPVLNAVGDVVNYRYMMSENVKGEGVLSGMLERDNRFEHLLGALAGNIFDKEMTVDQNKIAVQALKDQFDQEFATRSHSYRRVGKDSTDPEMREMWALLPESTKQSIRDIWGENNMMVRTDLMDINFGYRKLSIADTFKKDAAERNGVERVLYEMGLFMLGGLIDPSIDKGQDEYNRAMKAARRLKMGEDIWQAFVREAKDTMVVKSGITLLGNFSSNLTELMWFGVPIKDIVVHHRVAMKGALAYRKDSENLERINLQLSTGYLPAANQRILEREKVILEDALARNPVRELIDAGLMPTIVEDVSADDDMYSFKGRFNRKVDDFVDSLNPHVVNTAKTLMIAHDTPLYKALSYGTQLSDFVARYTLYQYMTQRERSPMSSEEAVQLVSDAFINYDVPSHRLMQYANDTGLIYFSKYYLRIQKVITHLYRENPGRALMLLTASHFFDTVPTLMDSAAVHRMGNPFSTGAWKYVTTLDETASINALMTPFK